ncbi:hypothetical protein GVY41_17290 [Frigidibacter albus]|uniref:Uncharacterized protein n=1 Tax=Frigidibacter albus TaxID=1465486 RepID=A0A6L8VLH7_9RHOB|nr:hypothetical protein [Frigidibacter albus]MZQ90586.1 hypothetical protein [Frigidibacter albus]NBE32758.1 hypothetical protein [Frigidibacter albus]GGH60767.1 hypothetical protein GCM10011341_33320 [Frigidibacter albus]
MDLDRADPKGLVRESYAIEGITLGECRSIFLDWALSLEAGVEVAGAIRALLAQYGAGATEHPMTGVLRAGLTGAEPPRRRGGRAGRFERG